MTARRPFVLDDDGGWSELQNGDTLIGGSLPVPSGIGQMLIATTAGAFTATLWLIDDNGFPIVDDSGYPVTDD